MAVYTVENESLRVCVSDLGAELQSVYDKRRGKEYLWQGDPAVWSGRAIWMFPVIGKLKDDGYTLGGKHYNMPMHGFAKGARFEAELFSARELRFTLTEDEERLKLFPWPFTLTVSYRLEGGSLHVEARVLNRGTDPMYFSIGMHPGFFASDGDRVVFDTDETPFCLRLDEATHRVRPGGERLPESGMVTLKAEQFRDDVMALDHPSFRTIELKRRCGDAVRVRVGEIGWLGLWTRYLPDGIRYICIEPWQGIDDPLETDGCIEHKPGIMILAPGAEHSFPVEITPVG